MRARSPATRIATPSVVFDVPIAVIGDIHGRADLLRQMIARLPDGMPIVVVGDVGDRGPDTRAVVGLLARHSALGVCGEHDAWLVRWANGGGFDAWLALMRGFGGTATLRSYGVHGSHASAIAGQHGRVPESHRRWLASLAPYLDLVVCGEAFLVTHAGVPSWCESGEIIDWERLGSECVRRLRWDSSAWVLGQRTLILSYPGGYLSLLGTRAPPTLIWPWNEEDILPGPERTVILGHFPLHRPLDAGTFIALDTGCGVTRSGTLTAVILPERRFVSVDGGRPRGAP